MNLDKINKLYSDNIRQMGIKPESVGWTRQGSQELRFEKLASVITNKSDMLEINELGCGYGEFYNYLSNNGCSVKKFRGYDISNEMLEAAKEYITHDQVEFLNNDCLNEVADYSFTSGIFNVKFDYSDLDWDEYIKKTILNLAEFSRKGMSFNLLSTYVDYQAENLYYGNPFEYFDFCKRHVSKKVNLIHDYDLFEWTITVTL